MVVPFRLPDGSTAGSVSISFDTVFKDLHRNLPRGERSGGKLVDEGCSGSMGGAANRAVLTQASSDSRRARDLCATGALSAGSCRSDALAQLHRAAFGQALSLELGFAKTQSAGSWIKVLVLADPLLCCRWVVALTAADANLGLLMARLSSPPRAARRSCFNV